VTERAGIALRTLGCKVNQAETDAFAAVLEGSGCRVVPEDACAVVVINTCTVTGEADHKARKAIRRALALPGAPTVVVTGCLATIDPAGVASLGERVVVEPDKSRVPEVAAALAGSAAQAPGGAGASTIARDVDAPPRAPAATPGRTRSRVQVKVQDGCDTRCRYCIVPDARGIPRSVPSDDVVSAVARLAAEGVAEVVLTGINIGRYRDGDVRLPGLVARVAATGVPRLRISSVEPGDVTSELLEVMASTPSVCGHLHVPLQSGCDRTLAAMGRPYDSAAFAAMLASAREALPGVALSTDVIVGFPGETDADHEASLAFISGAGFARLHVFRYSARAGTPAAGMAGQVPMPVRSERAAAMREAGEAGALRFSGSLVGRDVELLVERVDAAREGRPPLAEGVTREYVRMRVEAPAAVPGALLAVCVTGVAPDGTVTGTVA